MHLACDKITFAGDWHGNQICAIKAIKHAEKQGSKVIIQLGDFGVWSPYGYIKSLGDFAKSKGIHILFIDGNHEDFDWLLEQPVDEDGVRRLHENVWHLPRGFRFSISGINFLALGGAYSVDQEYRTPYVNWWPQETLTISDLYQAAEGGRVDIMLTHDCPNGVEVPVPPLKASQEVLDKASHHRYSLGEVVDTVKPKILFHGHYHVKYSYIRKYSDDSACVVYGLDKDGSPLDKNTLTCSIDDLMILCNYDKEKNNN